MSERRTYVKWNIHVPGSLDKQVEEAIASGSHVSKSELVKDAVRRLLEESVFSYSKKEGGYSLTNDKTVDSSTRVNYPQSVFSGVRKTVGFKCDTGLHGEFKRLAQAKMGSVCRPLECFEIAFLALNKEEVNFGTTVHIENLNVVRELRTRRKIVADKCGFEKCDKPAVAEGIFREKKIFPLCERHLIEAKSNPKNWRLL